MTRSQGQHEAMSAVVEILNRHQSVGHARSCAWLFFGDRGVQGEKTDIRSLFSESVMFSVMIPIARFSLLAKFPEASRLSDSDPAR